MLSAVWSEVTSLFGLFMHVLKRQFNERARRNPPPAFAFCGAVRSATGKDVRLPLEASRKRKLLCKHFAPPSLCSLNPRDPRVATVVVMVMVVVPGLLGVPGVK